MKKEKRLYLLVSLGELLEHVGVRLLVLLVVLPDSALADADLSSSRSVGRIHLKHLLEICHGQTELVTEQTGFSTAIQSLLVVLIQLDHLNRHNQFINT